MRHLTLSKLCLLSKCYNAALSVLEHSVLDVDPSSTGVTPVDLLLYSYYGGMIYTGLKKFQQAASYFYQCVTVPASAISAIMIESYKKYILVSLLANRKIKLNSKFSSSAIQRQLRASCLPYVQFSEAFHKPELPILNDSNVEIFKQDRNYGLIKQCIVKHLHNNIERHTQTYVTLALKDIAESLKLPSAVGVPEKEAEIIILRMIEEGQIVATIDQKEGMISFHEDDSYNLAEIMARLDMDIHNAIELAQKLKEQHEYIRCHPQYIRERLQKAASDRPATLGEPSDEAAIAASID